MLEDLRIVEFAEGVAGPLAALRLSELGARVVKVEEREGDYMRAAYPKAAGEDVAAAFIELNRGKRSIVLGTSGASRAQVLQRLVERADVFITDRTDEELAALGLEALLTASERGESKLISISLSAWGRRGPIANRKGSELTAQAMAGYTRYLGVHGQPARRLGADVGSVGTATFAVQAVLASIYARLRSGKGQRVDLSLCNSLLAMKSIHLAAQSNPDEYKGPRVGGANHPPELGWGARDGRIFMAFGGSVGPTGRAGWADFVKEVGLEKLIDDPRCDKTGRVTTGHGAHVHEMRSTYEDGVRHAFGRVSGGADPQASRQCFGISPPRSGARASADESARRGERSRSRRQDTQSAPLSRAIQQAATEGACAGAATRRAHARSRRGTRPHRSRACGCRRASVAVCRDALARRSGARPEPGEGDWIPMHCVCALLGLTDLERDVKGFMTL